MSILWKYTNVNPSISFRVDPEFNEGVNKQADLVDEIPRATKELIVGNK